MLTNIIILNIIPPYKQYYINKRNFILQADNLGDMIRRSMGFNVKIAIPLYFFLKIEYSFFILLAIGYPIISLNSMWILLTIWAIFASVIKPVLKVINWLVYKIATYPKGPILFFSAALTSIGSVLKLFVF